MIKNILSKTNKRSLKAYKNIIGMFTLKGVNIAVSFIMVPLTLHYLDETRYGIWITLSAIFNWFSLFDVGLGNGLRNRLSESLAVNDIKKARIYISTTYASLGIIFTACFLLFLIANIFIDWTVILNTSQQYRDELNLLAKVIFFFFCMRFVAGLITTVAFAKQEPAFSQFLDVSGRIVSLAGIYFLTRFSNGNLLYLGITLASLPVLTTFLISIYLFRRSYKDLCPSFSLIRFKELRYILNLGVKFFLIQIAAIVFYQTNNIIITQLFGPAQVTNYSIAFQYFSIATFVFITILTPYWSAFTEAYIKGEIEWIKNVMKNLKLIWFAFLIFVVGLYAFAGYLIPLWIGSKIPIQYDLYLIIAVYVVLNSFNAIYSQFLNGVGKVSVQLYLSSALTVFYIPLAIYSGKLFGLKGVMYPILFFSLISTFVLSLQYRKIINGTAAGKWNE